jgi:serine/threonine protein kinase
VRALRSPPAAARAVARAQSKLCDFGCAFRPDREPREGGEDTSYLVSRFYRAPEAILGLPHVATPIDVWALATCLFELYAGAVMFPGRTNNEMLRLVLDCRGAAPAHMVRAHLAAPGNKHEPHFCSKSLAFRNVVLEPAPPRDPRAQRDQRDQRDQQLQQQQHKQQQLLQQQQQQQIQHTAPQQHTPREPQEQPCSEGKPRDDVSAVRVVLVRHQEPAVVHLFRSTMFGSLSSLLRRPPVQ